jgi:hypothetical protein
MVLGKDLEIGFEDTWMIDEDPNAPLPAEEREEIEEMDEDERSEVLAWKNSISEDIAEGCKLTVAINQGWLCFNGAIHLWNIFLPVFQVKNFEGFVLTSLQPRLQEVIDHLNGFLDKT